MKVLLIYPDYTYTEYRSDEEWSGKYYQGIGFLSSMLKSKGHDVALLHPLKHPTEVEFTAKLAEHFDAGIIGFSFTTQMYQHVKKLIPICRKVMPRVPIICGGIFPTLNPESVLKENDVDFVCVGDGEIPLSELCASLEAGNGPAEVPNIWYKDSGAIVPRTFQNLTQDLDIYPFPDREIFDFPNLDSEKRGVTSLIGGRGCPYGCTYCSNNFLRDMYKGTGKFVRFRSPENVVQEAEQIVKKYPFIKEFFFSDDILPLKKDWFRELAMLYKERVGLPYHCAIFPSLISPDLLEILSTSGCKTLNIGVESGNEETRTKLLKRKLTNEQLQGVMELCREYDIQLLTFNILGLPGESLRDMLETVDMNAHAFKDKSSINAAASIFYPYEGTELYTKCIEEDLINEEERRLNSHFQDSILKYDDEERQIILAVKRNFDKLIAYSMDNGPLANMPASKVQGLIAEFDAMEQVGS